MYCTAATPTSRTHTCGRAVTLTGVFEELVHAFTRLPSDVDQRMPVENVARRTGRLATHRDGDDLRIATPCGGELLLRYTPDGRCDEIVGASAEHIDLTSGVAVTIEDATPSSETGDDRVVLIVESADDDLRMMSASPTRHAPDVLLWNRRAHLEPVSRLRVVHP